jgi:formate dehydrogenase iron-sulfur subunit
MQLNRRDFIKLSGAAVVGGGLLAPSTAIAQVSPEDQLSILYDSSKCIGCRACQAACKRWNKLPSEPTDNAVLPAEANDPAPLYDTPLGLTAHTWTLIKLNKKSETDWHFMNYQCMHCADAACVTVCPTGALYKDPKGFTAYDQSKCIGCGYCTQFCPYGVPHLNTQSVLTGKAKAAKCTFCQDRVYGGIGGPFCATTCPTGALVWGKRSELLAQAKERVGFLQGGGMSSAKLYGENEAGGLHRLSIVVGDPAEYNLPTKLAAPTVAGFWQNIIQVLGAVAIAGSTLGALVAFLISRTNIRMEGVE